jgi:glutathione S-transferase
MTGVYKIFGSEMSPYSVKVRSYFRYKAIPHQWVSRNADSDEEYRRYARLPIVPTIATPQGEGQQDSTPIIETLDALFSQPSIHPDDPDLAFLSALIEEFGDEWGNKLMFHHRWFADVDKQASAQTLAWLSLPGGRAEEIAARTLMIGERMGGRGHFVGSSPENAPYITQAYKDLLDLLGAHLAQRRYLFGARPAFGDFGLSGQLYEASVDPTCGAIMRARAPAVLDWCHRMMEPRADGGFETWTELAPTLAPVLAYIGATFLPWSAANAKALESGADTFTVELGGRPYTQGPQKYHARSLAALRAKYAGVAGRPGLSAILGAAGCTPYLA